MPLEDARRWNARYGTLAGATVPQPHSLLLEHQSLLPDHGRAVDIAMGRGGNAACLLAHNLCVVGIDISTVAVQAAKCHWPTLMAVVADLAMLSLPPDSFDVILNFYYLDRSLWPVYMQALRPGGLLIFETFTRARLVNRPEADPRYLLYPGELRAAFSGWDILTYRESGRDTAGQPCITASLVARRAR